MNIAYLVISSFLYLIIDYYLISLVQHSYYSIKRVGYRVIDQIRFYPYLSLVLLILNLLLVVPYFYPNYLLITLIPLILLIIFTPKVKLKFTYRAIRLLSTIFILELTLLLTTYFLNTKYLFICSCGIIVVPFSLCLSLLILCIYEIPRRNYCFKKAKRKIKDNENLIIIGITGSYGKTTIKNFIAQLLSPKEVLKSPGNINTSLGLANFIRNDLTLFDRLLILELGVDSIGGMKRFAKFIKLDYAVITGLGNQHLRTFKTYENIKKEKERIIDLIKPQGMIIYNEDEIRIIKNRKDIFYCPCSKKDYTKIYSDRNSTLINYNSTILKILFTTENLIFDSYLSFVVASKISSSNLIKLNLANLSLPIRRKKIYQKDKLTVIDDSYNLNLKGLKEAIKQMEKYKEPHVVLTGGLKETGQNIAMLYSFFTMLNEVDEVYYFSKLTKKEKNIILGIPGLYQKIHTVKKFIYPKEGCLLILTMGDKSSLC